MLFQYRIEFIFEIVYINMTNSTSTIIIVVVIAAAIYLIYSQNSQPKYIQVPLPASTGTVQNPVNREYFNNQQPNPQLNSSGQYPSYPLQPNPNQLYSPSAPYPSQNPPSPYTTRAQPVQPSITNVVIDNNTDPYSDAIKKQDTYTMYDPLTYPQLRLPREVLERYNEFYEKNGTYPPFNQATQPFLFDNPILNGNLIKIVEENEPFNDNVPNAVPLFRVKSAKNANRYFYYVIDQRYFSQLEPKIPLDHVCINGKMYNNADFYGLPEIFDGDVIENIPIFPGARFRVSLYKTYHFP
jgi:hypothetical protein